jgi:hypothetical protein
MNGLVPGLAPSNAPSLRSRGRLRLLDGPAAASARSSSIERPKAADTAVAPEWGHVLVVGVEARARAHMLCELRDVLPSGTRFVETEETWKALALAEGSKMVVLVGDPRGLSGTSMVRLLARRQPTLPVLAVSGVASSAYPDFASG